jgi:protein gp37
MSQEKVEGFKATEPKIKNPTMSDASKNWNVVTGCDKYSDGCLNCYGEPMVEYLKRIKNDHYIKNGFKLTMCHDRLNWPLQKLAKNPRRPAKSFVTDMGDPLHEAVTDQFLKQVFDVMAQVPQHRFYFLTKRAERLGEIGPQLPWKPWIWAGVTVESAKYVHRIDQLKKLPGDVNKFLIFEPLLSPIPQLDLEGIGWVVVGGETNKKMKYRPLKEEWVIGIKDQVKAAGLPFMFKHWPGKTAKSKPALLEGKIWDEYPESLLVNMNW